MVRELACPICGDARGRRLDGYDRKAGPEVFELLGLPAPVSRWTVCDGCGFVFQNPRAEPERILALYASGRYREDRRYADHFFRNRYRYPVEHLRWFRRHAPLAPRPRVLDIGAGYGGAVRAFCDLGAVAEGLEIDPQLCAVAQERFGVELLRADFGAAPLEEGAYDVVYSAHTHEHFDDVLAVNAKIRRLLKPGGHLLLVLPTFRFGAFNAQGFLNVFHTSLFTARSLRNMLARSGFEPVAFRYPLEHSRPEVWGIGRKVDGTWPPVELRRDRPGLVAWEIRHAPALFEGVYRVTDLPLRAARRLRRRLEGRAAWPEWTGSRP